MALQQAEMHDIGQAVQSITKAIQSNPTHLPSWHLLTLIISCPNQGDYKQALKTCEMGLQQASQAAGYADIIDNYNGTGHDEAEQHLTFQLTRTLLLYALHGPESALESSETLFGLYGKIAIPELSLSTNSQQDRLVGGAHNQMIVSGSLGNLGDLSIEKRRGRSASNVSHHLTAFSSSDLSSHLGSRSHENVTTSTSNTITAGRARSASNLTVNPSPLGPGGGAQTSGGLLAVPGEAPVVQQQQHHHHHVHGLHLFGSRSTSNRSKAAIDTSPITPVSGSGSNQSLQSFPYGGKCTQIIKSQFILLTHILHRLEEHCRCLSHITSKYYPFHHEPTLYFTTHRDTQQTEYTYRTTQTKIRSHSFRPLVTHCSYVYRTW